jgi:hypothetical protein
MNGKTMLKPIAPVKFTSKSAEKGPTTLDEAPLLL